MNIFTVSIITYIFDRITCVPTFVCIFSVFLSGYMRDLEDACISIESYSCDGGIDSCINYKREETPAEKRTREKIEEKEAAIKIKAAESIEKKELKELVSIYTIQKMLQLYEKSFTMSNLRKMPLQVYI